MTISAIATMEIKEAGCFFKANLHLCNTLQWNAAEVLKQFLAHVLFRPFDAEGLNLMRNGICEYIRKNPTKLAKRCQDRTHKFKLLAVQSTMPWKGTAKKSERITGIPHTTGIPTICCCAKPTFTRKLKQTKPKFDALSGRILSKSVYVAQNTNDVHCLLNSRQLAAKEEAFIEVDGPGLIAGCL